jgi:peptide/nickel transport system ATP-binding protein
VSSLGRPLLAVEHLQVEFHVEGRGWVAAVDDVSFEVNPHQTIALVGESGSGKTVTSLAIMGLVAPPAVRVRGQVTFEGRNLVGLPRRDLAEIRGRDIAMIFQEPQARLNPSLKIGLQIAEVLERHRGMSRTEAWARAVELLQDVEIASARAVVHAYPHELSGGMCQRVLIATALACKPKLLIADEPTTALDVTVQAQILELLKRIQKDAGMAMIFVTHDLGIAADICDRAIVMYAGQIVERSEIRPMFAKPRHPYTEGLLRSMPRAKFDAAPAGADRGRYRLPTIRGVSPPPWAHPSGCRFHPRCDYAVAGLCDREHVLLRDAGGGDFARCVRLAELALAGL